MISFEETILYIFEETFFLFIFLKSSSRFTPNDNICIYVNMLNLLIIYVNCLRYYLFYCFIHVLDQALYEITFSNH